MFLPVCLLACGVAIRDHLATIASFEAISGLAACCADRRNIIIGCDHRTASGRRCFCSTKIQLLQKPYGARKIGGCGHCLVRRWALGGYLCRGFRDYWRLCRPVVGSRPVKKIEVRAVALGTWMTCRHVSSNKASLSNLHRTPNRFLVCALI